MYNRFFPGNYSVWEPHDSIPNSSVNSYYTDDSDNVAKVGVARILNFFKFSHYNLIYYVNLLISFNNTINNFLIPIISSKFFPEINLLIKLLSLYGLQFVWLLGKPIGLLLFGSLAGSKGPVLALNIAMMFFIFALFIMGIISSFNNIKGLFLLIFLKIIETISSSGIKFISKNYLIDNLKNHRLVTIKSIYFYNVYYLIGSILATLIAILALNSSNAKFCLYILRIIYVFISAAILGLLLILNNYFNVKKYIITKNTTISVAKSSYKNFQLNNGIKKFLIDLSFNKYIILKIAVVMCFTNVTYTLVFSFLHFFIPTVTKINLNNMFKLDLFLLILDFVILLILGKILIKHDSKKLLLLSSISLTITILPLLLELTKSSIYNVTFIASWIIFWGVIFSCRASIWCYALVAELPKKYLWLALGSILGGDLIGKNTAAICWYLWYIQKDLLLPAIYLTILFGMTTLVIFKSDNDMTLAKN